MIWFGDLGEKRLGIQCLDVRRRANVLLVDHTSGRKTRGGSQRHLIDRNAAASERVNRESITVSITHWKFYGDGER